MRVNDMAAKIFDDIGVKPQMHALQQRIARVRLGHFAAGRMAAGS
jgi:hypothetical protein